MDLSILKEWIDKSGLTIEEVATIQPQYGRRPNYFIDPAYAVASSMLGGMNIATSTINLATINNPKQSMVVPYLGFTSGATSTTLGLIKFDPTNRAISMLNIGLGTTTMFISAYRLIRKESLQPKSSSLNMYSFPTADNQMGLGLALTRKF